MDTKLKKFNRSTFTKTVCFVLAVIFVILAAGRTFDLATDVLSDFDNKNLGSYYENILFQGKAFDLTTSKPFKYEYKKFIRSAYRDALVFGDGSKKAYESYKNKSGTFFKEAYNKSKESMLEKIVDESGGYNFYHTFLYTVDRETVTLKKIADTQNVTMGDYYVYDDQNYYYDLPDDEYEDEEYDTTYMHTTQVPQTVVPTEPAFAPSDVYSPAVTESEDKKIPDEIIRKAGNCDAIVEIGRAYANGSMHSGYYAVTVNEHNLKREIIDDYCDGNILNDFSDYEDFLRSRKENLETLSAYKSFFYAFYFESDGKLITNHPGLSSKSTKAEIEKNFTSYSWNYKKDARTNAISFSEDISSIINNSPDSSYYSMLSADLLSTDFGDLSEFFGKGLKIYVSLDDISNETDTISTMAQTYYRIYEDLTDALWFIGIMLLLFILFTVFLVSQSGRKGEDNEIHMLFSDSIFTSVRLIINGGIIFLCVMGIFFLLDSLFSGSASYFLIKLCLSVLCGVITVFLLDFILFISRHIKNKSFLRNFIIGRIIYSVLSAKKAVAERKQKAKEKAENTVIYKDIFKDVSVKLLLFVFVPNIFVAFWLIVFAGWEDWGFFWLTLIPLFFYDCLILFYMIKYTYHLKAVLKALHEIRGGNYDVWVETTGMPKTVLAYAEDVNAIRNGLKIAVDNAIKEEKTKTELITNVSHDLKTPLTSIITYVDLLSRCNIEDKKALDYIEVLKEKGEKLKRLIEDLVEATKAKTGNMKVELMKVSLNELIMQLAGEYEDEFSSKGLRLIINGTGLDLSIMADSKMSYRILDNLFTNIRKYAMPSTRVYLTVSRENDKAVVTLRNISECQLNIPASELMERFVRGDASRSTEGNGLGLSIAENLAALQGGNLNIDISGDLFTATVKFLLG